MPAVSARVVAMLDALAERRVPSLLAYGVAVLSVILGSVLVFVPDPAWVAREWGAAFHFASPTAWGTALVVLGVSLGVGYGFDPRSARLPALLVTLYFTALAALIIVGPARGGRPDLLVFVIFAAYVSALVVITAGGGRRG